MTHPYDNAGLQVVENGDTEDGAYLAPVDIGGIGLWQPYNQATARGFTMADNAIMDGTDLNPVRIIFKTGDLSATSEYGGKYTAGGQVEWWFQVNTSGVPQFIISEDGTATTTFGYNALTCVADTWYAVAVDYNETAQTLDWTQHTVAAAVAGDWSSGTNAEQDDTSAVTTMHNGTSALVWGGLLASGGGSLLAAGRAVAPIRYAQVVFDGGTVTFDPTRDAAIGSTSFTDSDSALSWALQTTTTQTDWPTLATPALSFDGGDWLATSYTPTFTPTTGELTVYVVTTPDAASADGDRIVSSESAANNGLAMMIQTGETVAQSRVGGSVTNVSKNSPANLSAGTRASMAAVVDDGTLATYENTGGLTATSDITGVGTITHVPVQVGARSFDDGVPYNGTIETVLIFERALTAAELASLDAHYGL